MSIRTVLVPFNGEAEDKASLETAFEIAKKFQAHVQCLYVSPEVVSYIYPDIGMPNPALGGYLEEFEKTSQARLENAKALFKSLSSQHKIPIEERLTASRQASTYFQMESGDMEHQIIQQGKLSDLIVVQGRFSSGNAPYKPWAVTSLFETGKPVILTPNQSSKTIGKTVLVAWNGSVESARALHYALPFLKEAKDVYVLVINDEVGKEISVEAVALYLKLHNISVKPLISHHKGHAIGQALLNEAKEVEADLLVMGAFTHTRLRQMIMGGVTNFMLEHMEIPVFMAH